MELCTQCKLPEGAHKRRIFGHDFKRPQPAVESSPGIADAGAVLVDGSDVSYEIGVDPGCDVSADPGCGGDSDE